MYVVGANEFVGSTGCAVIAQALAHIEAGWKE
jgi:hypothetical protein